jgi:lysophospholipase L1-like esterase
MLKIVALADSLAMPRRENGETVAWEETWPVRLREKLDVVLPEPVEVINHGRRARTVDSLIGPDFEENIRFIRPEVVIIQVGIVDCAPRIFSRRTRALLQSRLFPSRLRRAVVAWGSRQRHRLIGRRPLARVYTCPERFSAGLRAFGDRLQALEWQPQLVVLPIVLEWRSGEAKSPGYGANVRLYNGLLEAFCRDAGASWVEIPTLMQAGSDLSSYFLYDGYHLSPQGNEVMAQALAKNLVSHLQNSPPNGDDQTRNLGRRVSSS